MPDYTAIIEANRKAGRPNDPGMFKDPDARMALQKLTKADRESKMTPMQMAEQEQQRRTGTLARPPAFKRGGMVKKTGMAKVHKGEKVLTKRQVKGGYR